MSAPDTNIETQQRRHSFPLKGMALVVGFAAILYIGYLAVLAEKGDEPSVGNNAATASDG